MLSNQANGWDKDRTSRKAQVYVVRIDTKIATSLMIKGESEEGERNIQLAYENFCKNLLGALSICLNKAGEEIKVVELNSVLQESVFYNFYNSKVRTCNDLVINLDKCMFTINLPSLYHLSVSRVFADKDQYKAKKLYIKNLDYIIDVIKNNRISKIHLIDDDIASGQTVNELEGELKKNAISVTSSTSLLHLSKPLIHQFVKSDFEIYDVVDARDFLPGAHMGGLSFCSDYLAQASEISGKYLFKSGELDSEDRVDWVPKRPKRVSYLDSRVNLLTRARIPVCEQEKFREMVAHYAQDFYRLIGNKDNVNGDCFFES